MKITKNKKTMRKFIVFLMAAIMTVMCVSCGNSKDQQTTSENDTIVEEMIDDTVEILEDTATVIYQDEI